MVGERRLAATASTPACRSPAPPERQGRDILRGAELALERSDHGSIEIVALDTHGPDRDERARDHARGAAADPDALAYLGDFHSSQITATAPILSAAGLLQVAPAATFAGLAGVTLVRLMPSDAGLAHGIADWLTGPGKVRKLLVVHDGDPGYGAPVGLMCAEAAIERGIETRSRPVWRRDESITDDVAGAETVLYVGVPGPGTAPSGATCTPSIQGCGCSPPTGWLSSGWPGRSMRMRRG